MPLNKPNYGNKTSDIFGASPQCVKFQSNRAGNDPLNPVYNLSKVEYKPPTPTKFRRDSMALDDIEGTRSRPICKGGLEARAVN